MAATLVCFCAYLHGNPDRVYADEEKTQKFVDSIAEAAAYVRNPANRDEVAEIGTRFVNMTKEEVLSGLDFWVYDPRIGPNTAKAFRKSVRFADRAEENEEPVRSGALSRLEIHPVDDEAPSGMVCGLG